MKTVIERLAESMEEFYQIEYDLSEGNFLADQLRKELESFPQDLSQSEIDFLALGTYPVQGGPRMNADRLLSHPNYKAVNDLLTEIVNAAATDD